MPKLLVNLLLVLCWFKYNYCSQDVDSNHITQFFINDTCNLPIKLKTEIQGYQEIVEKIIDDIVNGKYADKIYSSILKTQEKFRFRYTGTKELEDAIDYMVDKLKSEGLENVHTENATVQHWIRGNETAELLSPLKLKLNVIGLGTSVGTPPGGIIGDVIVVESFEELHAMPDEAVRGKIVVFAPKWRGCGQIVHYRNLGATEASKKGAIASLIRSTSPYVASFLHNGIQTYKDGVKKIPTASITVEDIDRLLQMYKNGERIQIHLEMEDKNLPPVISRNTIGELTGTVHKNKSVVVLSGHLDSWSYQGSPVDDIGGAFISWKALQFLKDMGLRPKRTLRAILWTGEKFGMMGAEAYQNVHKENEEEEFNFFLESDNGRHEPNGLEFGGNKDAECILREILNLMTHLNATSLRTPMDGGADIDLWVSRGFPGATAYESNKKYFEKLLTFTYVKLFNTSPNETILLEHPINLDKCAALFAATAYVIADLSIDIPKNVRN